MDEDSLLSGRRVHEGEVIGQIGNFHKREGGTSYHLHFDVQVPTRDGWVFVNPYMTLVAAYERLIGGRGEEIVPAVAIATTDLSTTGTAAPASIAIEPEQAQRPRRGDRASKKRKAGKHAKHQKPKKYRIARR
jgi:murein DD-endopeptidase MepM/ murein hydrolase activator NlpD